VSYSLYSNNNNNNNNGEPVPEADIDIFPGTGEKKKENFSCLNAGAFLTPGPGIQDG
jgi:hypothetical protein